MKLRKFIDLHETYTCGANPDWKRSKDMILTHLQPDERIVIDSGYAHITFISPTTVTVEKKTVHAKLRARHESVNERFKYFNFLHYIFRHDISLHCQLFHYFASFTALLTFNGNFLLN